MYGNSTGVKSFEENRALFSGARTEPEKFNLYTGLALMAASLEKQEKMISDLQKEVHKLKRMIHMK